MQMKLRGWADQPPKKQKPFWRRSAHARKTIFKLQPARAKTNDAPSTWPDSAFDETSDEEEDTVFVGFAKSTAFRCKTCGHIASKKSNLIVHMNTHRDDNQTDDLDTKFEVANEGPGRGCTPDRAKLAVKRSFRCKICNHETNQMNNIKAHVKTHEPKDNIALRDFEDQYERIKQGPSPKYLPRCKICHMTFKWKANLVRHMSIHSNGGKFQCTQCGARFQAKTALSKHIHRHSNPFMCKGCDTTFDSKNELQEHVKTFGKIEAVPTRNRQGQLRSTAEHKKVMRARVERYVTTKVIKPAYALDCCNPAGLWSHIQQIEDDEQTLKLEVPISLKSGSDPYLIGHNASPELKTELRDAVTTQTAALMRLFKKMGQYDLPTYLIYDHLDESQYPLLPAQNMTNKDTCGFVMNTQHYLYKRYKEQTRRSLTVSATSAQYAQRDPPIQGDWFEFYFTGYTFLKHSHLVKDIQQNEEVNAVAFLAYCTAWELKGRPLTPEHSHDRIDNNRGYTFHNTVWANKKVQALNRESGVARRRYRGHIQEEFQSPHNWVASTDRLKQTVAGGKLIKKQTHASRKNKRKRLQREAKGQNKQQ